MIIRLFFFPCAGRITDDIDWRRGVSVSLPFTRLKGLLPMLRFDGGVLAFRGVGMIGVRAQSFTDCSSSPLSGDFRFFALLCSLHFVWLEPPP